MADTGTASQKAWVEQRKGRYMAQTLEAFEETIEPLIPAEVAKAFKVLVRRKISAMAADFNSLLELEDKAINGVAQDLMDSIFPDGPPPRKA